MAECPREWYFSRWLTAVERVEAGPFEASNSGTSDKSGRPSNIVTTSKPNARTNPQLVTLPQNEAHQEICAALFLMRFLKAPVNSIQRCRSFGAIKTWNFDLACSSSSDNQPIQRSVLVPATELNWSDRRFCMNTGLARCQVKFPVIHSNSQAETRDCNEITICPLTSPVSMHLAQRVTLNSP